MYGSWVEIDLAKLAENIRALQAAAQVPSELIFVVKSDAYGHGMRAVAERAAQAGIRWFAVAYPAEAFLLREKIPAAEILVIGVAQPADVAALIAQRITPIVTGLEHARRLDAAAQAAGKKLRVHAKIDTGMGRLGIPWFAVAGELPQVFQLPHLEVTGLCTHFATVMPEQPERAQAQVERFQAAEAVARQCGGGRPLFRHISSSRAFLLCPGWDFEGVRPGIVFYGYGAKDAHKRFHTRPILQWKSRVMQIKAVPEDFPVGYFSSFVTTTPTDIATVAVGYADGYLRHLSNKGHVLIGGRRCSVVGRISMNWITVDAGPDSGVKPGDEVVLIGEQGEESIWADELAAACGTIPYEIVTRIHPWIERRYIG